MLNKWVGIGRLTRDAELRYTPNGNATCSFTLACDRQFKNVQGEKETDFINIVVPPYRAKLAEICAQYLAKGKLAAVVGFIQTRSYEKEDRKVYVTEIIAEEVKFLSPREKNTNSSQPADLSSVATEVSLEEELPF
jgi:single-strand DNA-binding protein